ncbi:hypothetical protein [Agathobaculum sp. Marseille-P7918]|uniref:hypothetical protein n=1 Tax=Agathobaculum sp. Marseille-P7918 TaxID=2479843 RepID=UPI000F64221B|nr:hypothetical protein [Agathobaculum sp. Marseille-P7918]
MEEILPPIFYIKAHLISHNNLNGPMWSIQYPGCIVFRENFICTLPTPVSAAIVRVPRLFSAVGKNAKKSRRRELQMRYPETIPRPGVAGTFIHSTWGYPTPSRSPSCEGNSFTRSQSGFRSKLKLHFQEAIFTRKCSTSEQN